MTTDTITTTVYLAAHEIDGMSGYHEIVGAFATYEGAEEHIRGECHGRIKRLQGGSHFGCGDYRSDYDTRHRFYIRSFNVKP